MSTSSFDHLQFHKSRRRVSPRRGYFVHPWNADFCLQLLHPCFTVPSSQSPSRPFPSNYFASAMRTSSTSGPVNMCRLLVHKYSCGHSKTDVAPCAGHRGGGCSGTTEKIVAHKEKCARCGKCMCLHTPRERGRADEQIGPSRESS